MHTLYGFSEGLDIFFSLLISLLGMGKFRSLLLQLFLSRLNEQLVLSSPGLVLLHFPVLGLDRLRLVEKFVPQLFVLPDKLVKLRVNLSKGEKEKREREEERRRNLPARPREERLKPQKPQSSRHRGGVSTYTETPVHPQVSADMLGLRVGGDRNVCTDL